MYRRDDGQGFGSGLGGSFGTSGRYDPHRVYDGPYATRGVGRDGSRVARTHEDEHPEQFEPPHRAPALHREHGGFSNYAGGGNRDHRMSGRPHFSEQEAQRYGMQHGYGQSQYPQSYGSPSDMGFGERDWERGAAQGVESQRGPHYGKGPKGYKRSDERIREEVCELMSRQGYVDASDVEVFVEGGVIRLVGTVATRNEKRALEQMCDHVHGVEEVENQIRLRRGETGVTSSEKSQPSQRNPAPTSLNGKTAHT